MNRRTVLKNILAGVAARPVVRAASGTKPNIILCMSDDQGWGDVGYNGHPYVKTPNLDAMSRAGIRFDRFYSGAPVCSPTRGSALTGRHPFYLGSVPETGSPVRTWVRLVGLPQVAQATAAAGLGSLPSPAGGGRLGGLARPPRRRRVGPFPPRISGPCGSLVGPSHQFLRDLNGSVGVAPYRKRTGTQE